VEVGPAGYATLAHRCVAGFAASSSGHKRRMQKPPHPQQSRTRSTVGTASGLHAHLKTGGQAVAMVGWPRARSAIWLGMQMLQGGHVTESKHAVVHQLNRSKACDLEVARSIDASARIDAPPFLRESRLKCRGAVGFAFLPLG
jgi:hypothetical protein